MTEHSVSNGLLGRSRRTSTIYCFERQTRFFQIQAIPHCFASSHEPPGDHTSSQAEIWLSLCQIYVLQTGLGLEKASLKKERVLEEKLPFIYQSERERDKAKVLCRFRH